MWVANLVDPWRGDSNSIPVMEFFESIDEAAEMGRLTAKDKVHLVKLKLKGAARAFHSAQVQLRADDVTYAALRTAFVNRFKDKHTNQYCYTRVQNASQEKGESPEMFLDRLRKLCQRTVRTSENAVEQAVINQEADRRLLAAFINGLSGLPGKQVRLQMPKNIDKALNKAIVANIAEREERAMTRDNRGASAQVFAVGGSRGNNTGNKRHGQPRGRNRWSGNRGARFQHGTGPTQYSTRVDGTYSDRTDDRTPTGPSDARAVGGDCAMSGPKDDDGRRALQPRGISCFNCGLEGHFRRNCPRGQRKNLNGIGGTKTTPSFNPK